MDRKKQLLNRSYINFLKSTLILPCQRHVLKKLKRVEKGEKLTLRKRERELILSLRTKVVERVVNDHFRGYEEITEKEAEYLDAVVQLTLDFGE